MTIERFEDLEIWQLARELCKFVYEITEKEPFCKDFPLRNQMRSSSGSVMDCIAEGFERDGTKEFINFLSIAKGSCVECRSQSYRAFDYKYINQAILEELIERATTLSKKIASFMSYLKGSKIKGTQYK